MPTYACIASKSFAMSERYVLVDLTEPIISVLEYSQEIIINLVIPPSTGASTNISAPPIPYCGIAAAVFPIHIANGLLPEISFVVSVPVKGFKNSGSCGAVVVATVVVVSGEIAVVVVV